MGLTHKGEQTNAIETLYSRSALLTVEVRDLDLTSWCLGRRPKCYTSNSKPHGQGGVSTKAKQTNSTFRAAFRDRMRPRPLERLIDTNALEALAKVLGDETEVQI